ncbi:hypothetical protein K1719_028828 [Acacia pycnantha]|nr:hypothetical protein K1719_028828 [Acacia pycnantha]
MLTHPVVRSTYARLLDQDVKEPALELRRSQRVVIPSSVLKSPWIEPKRKSKGKRTYDEKDTIFEMCTKSVPRDEAAEEFVDMHHYFLTREELQCLTPRSWINNKRNHFLAILRTLKRSCYKMTTKSPKMLHGLKSTSNRTRILVGFMCLHGYKCGMAQSKERMGTQCHSTQTKNFMN